uniref:CHCH domain-containing protein n=1 Tax=Glossina palpalis gambiensis TaxID=67801 RepID=A0A1B0BS47_9MUSC
MGAARSKEPRSVSMDNPSPAGVIDVSDDVVERLKLGISRQAKDSGKMKTTGISAAKEVPVSVADAPAVQRQPAVVYQNPPPVVYSGPAGFTITAADIRRQKDIELQQNDAMWRQRMSQLEQNLKKTNTIMEAEYSSAVEDVRKRFASAPATLQPPPCQDLKAQIIACYRANPGETLKCAEQVAAFRNCVNAHRVKTLDEEDPKGKTTVSKTSTAKAA